MSVRHAVAFTSLDLSYIERSIFKFIRANIYGPERDEKQAEMGGPWFGFRRVSDLDAREIKPTIVIFTNVK